jgi:hypothetical protein
MRYLYADAFRFVTANVSIPIFKAMIRAQSLEHQPLHRSRGQRLARSRFYKHSSETPGANPNPTFFQTGSAREPYNRGQWGSALRATPQATMGDVTDGRGLQTTCTFTCPRFPASLASLTD